MKGRESLADVAVAGRLDIQGETPFREGSESFSWGQAAACLNEEPKR